MCASELSQATQSSVKEESQKLSKVSGVLHVVTKSPVSHTVLRNAVV